MSNVEIEVIAAGIGIDIPPATLAEAQAMLDQIRQNRGWQAAHRALAEAVQLRSLQR